MKFSVLLPTRDRLELLKCAVETVRRQDYQDWEIIISDNHSEQDVGHYVRSLGDDRIRYHRTDKPVPVTENWNNALRLSSGDYIIMLGDDDCLMKGFFKIVMGLVEEYERPDFIYSRVLLYAYPGVMPGFPEGFLRTNGWAPFFGKNERPFFLDTSIARTLVHQSVNFRLPFEPNMQYSVVSRKFIEEVSRGDFFQSPFPDYYASNVMFLKGERILINPMPIAVVGISPKSFGFYYFNDKEEQGVEFLQNQWGALVSERLASVILPGTSMNTSWLLAMEALKANYGADVSCEVNYRRYRALQLIDLYDRCKTRGEAWDNTMGGLAQRLTLRERFSFGIRLWSWRVLERMVGPGRLGRHLRSILNNLERVVGSGRLGGYIRSVLGFSNPYPAHAPPLCAKRYANILDVFENVSPQHGLKFALPEKPCANQGN